MRWLNVLLILITFLSYLSPYINPESFWPVNFIGIAYPWLLLLNLLFVAFWLLRRNWYFLFSFACILMGWSHLTGFWGFHFFQATTSQDINVMSYNIQYLQYVKGKPEIKERKLKEIATFLKAAQPSVLCLQETSDYSVQMLKEELAFQHYYRAEKKGTAILSKFPLIASGIVEFGSNTNSCTWVDIELNKQTIRIYSIHLQSNQVSGLADHVRAKGDLQEKETWKDIKGMIGRVKRATAIRVRQAQLVKNHIATSPHPVIICADLNDTPQSFVYHLLSEQLCDAFREKGSGIGTTYAGAIPALRIDYIFISDHWRVSNYEVVKQKYSDHYPVISGLQLK